ncbi:MAG: hypothetical protein K8E66_12305 [Phycisphaerales bacterium]|nr:hypothetical protein [Phycisphaerales bacterium]
MRRLIGCVLIIVGALLVCTGAVNAVLEFGAIYTQVSDDPLAEPVVDEEARAGRMLWHAGYGVAGLVPLGIGTVLVKFGRRRSG